MRTLGYIIATCEFYREQDQWVGNCVQLGTSVCAPTFEEILEDLKDALALHLNTLEDVGERKRFFKEHGIRIFTHKPRYRTSKAPLPLNGDRFVQKQCLPVGA